MFTFKKVVCLFFLTTGLCDAGYITDETFQKCGLKDTECHRKAIEAVIEKAKTGILEFGIPPMDPYEVKNTTVSVLSMVDFTMTDGKVEGATNCPFTKFDMDIDNGITTTESFCEQITVSGHYSIVAAPLVKVLTGDALSGDGIGKIQIEKMTLKMKIPFSFEKSKEDDEIYIVPTISEAKYSTDDIEKISFEADNVFFGTQEVSQQITGFMNRNWKTILSSFGKFFSDKIMDVFYDYLQKFFLEVPAKYYISDDLSTYVKP